MDRILKMNKYTILKELEKALNFRNQKGTYIKTIKPDEIFEEQTINPTTELYQVKMNDKTIKVPIIKDLFDDPEKKEIEKIKSMLRNTSSKQGREILMLLLKQEQKLKETADLEDKRRVKVIPDKSPKKDDEEPPKKEGAREIMERYENLGGPDFEEDAVMSDDDPMDFLGNEDMDELEFDDGYGTWMSGNSSRTSAVPSVPMDDEDREFLQRMRKLFGEEEEDIPIRIVDDTKKKRNIEEDLETLKKISKMTKQSLAKKMDKVASMDLETLKKISEMTSQSLAKKMGKVATMDLEQEEEDALLRLVEEAKKRKKLTETPKKKSKDEKWIEKKGKELEAFKKISEMTKQSLAQKKDKVTDMDLETLGKISEMTKQSLAKKMDKVTAMDLELDLKAFGNISKMTKQSLLKKLEKVADMAEEEKLIVPENDLETLGKMSKMTKESLAQKMKKVATMDSEKSLKQDLENDLETFGKISKMTKESLAKRIKKVANMDLEKDLGKDLETFGKISEMTKQSLAAMMKKVASMKGKEKTKILEKDLANFEKISELTKQSLARMTKKVANMDEEQDLKKDLELFTKMSKNSKESLLKKLEKFVDMKDLEEEIVEVAEPVPVPVPVPAQAPMSFEREDWVHPNAPDSQQKYKKAIKTITDNLKKNITLGDETKIKKGLQSAAKMKNIINSWNKIAKESGEKEYFKRGVLSGLAKQIKKAGQFLAN